MKNDQRRLRDRVAVFACIAIAAIAIDQLTKMWALSALADGRTIRVIPGLLSLTLVRNPGASLGMGSGMTWLISLLAMAACVALVVLCRPHHFHEMDGAVRLRLRRSVRQLIDRVIYAEGFLNGKVVDFLNYGWSIGNVADIFLMLAGVAAVLLLLGGTVQPKATFDEANGKTLGDDANANRRRGEKQHEPFRTPPPDALSSANDRRRGRQNAWHFPAKAADLIESGTGAVLGRTFPNRRPCRAKTVESRHRRGTVRTGTDRP